MLQKSTQQTCSLLPEHTFYLFLETFHRKSLCPLFLQSRRPSLFGITSFRVRRRDRVTRNPPPYDSRAPEVRPLRNTQTPKKSAYESTHPTQKPSKWLLLGAGGANFTFASVLMLISPPYFACSFFGWQRRACFQQCRSA